MLEGRTYVPLLHARLAEMRALRELPTATKNAIFPVVRVRPWLGAKRLDKVFGVIDEAIGDRAFGFDLDSSMYDPASDRPAHIEFAQLFDATNGYATYYDCVEQFENRIPVLRGDGAAGFEIGAQLDRIIDLDRGLIVRLSINEFANVANIARLCVAADLENVVFVFDCGWRTDVLQLAAICTGSVQNLMDISESYEVVVAGSSFPNAFGGQGDRFSIRVNERLLYQEVRRAVNRGIIFYGDWASTRPPTPPLPMKNVPRIDMANRVQWTCWRSEGGESYLEVAERVVEDPDWDGNIGVWGEYMIESTAEGVDPSIKSPAMAAAVRVNLHMHMQTNFDNPQGLIVPDEPVGDDL